MSDTAASPALSRRNLLKVGLLGSALLATASLGGCSASTPAPGLLVIRASDLPLLHALVPVMLAGAVDASGIERARDATIVGLDSGLAHLSPAMRDLTLQLFDVLSLPLTRGPLTGIWGAWENASAEQVQHFLQRWQNSRVGLLQMGHAALLQLVMMAWYGQAEAWRHCGYPGPPRV